MPEIRSADWSKVRFRCQVIFVPDPATLRIQIENREIDFDEEVHHWDYLGARVCYLSGRQIHMRAVCLPDDLRRLNSVFWIAHDNAIIPHDLLPKRLIFRGETDADPVAVVTAEPGEW